jgi:hypothetical protein
MSNTIDRNALVSFVGRLLATHRMGGYDLTADDWRNLRDMHLAACRERHQEHAGESQAVRCICSDLERGRVPSLAKWYSNDGDPGRAADDEPFGEF